MARPPAHDPPETPVVPTERTQAHHTPEPATPTLPPPRRILRSFGYALRGIVTVARTQPNFLVHLVAAVLALTLGALLRVSAVEFALIVLTIALVLTAEALNTALEAVCDLVQPTYHPMIKRAKDASAAAVLLAAIGSVLIAALIFLPHLR